MEKKTITKQEIRYLTVGAIALNTNVENPGKSWLSDKKWASI